VSSCITGGPAAAPQPPPPAAAGSAAAALAAAARNASSRATTLDAVFGQAFGPTSRCFMSTLSPPGASQPVPQAPACYQATCADDRLSVKISVAGGSVRCRPHHPAPWKARKQRRAGG